MTADSAGVHGTAPSPPPSNRRISIIVPTLDEAENVDELIRDILGATSALGQVEVIVVDDGSTDGTRQRIMAWEADPSARGAVRLLARDGERGLAQAVLAGAEHASGEILVVMDADLSHPAQRIPDLVKPILDGTSDMAIGSRYVPGGSMPGWPAKRRLMSRAAALLAWPIVDVRDPMSGFFAVRRERLLMAGVRAGGFKIGLEVLARSGEMLRVTEVPIEFRNRTRGISKMGWSVTIAYLRGLLSLGGGEVSPGTATRFGLVGVLGMLVDLLIFRYLYSAGYGLALAHLSSFLAATVFNYIFNARWSFMGSARRGHVREGSRYLRFLAVGLMALFLRGAVLAFLVEIVRCPPTLAVVGAVGAAAAINFLGSAFYVFAPEDAPSMELRWRIAALGIAVYLLALRLFYLGLPDLLVEEAYYWNYAQHLDLSYLDHPPLVAWMIWLGTGLFGNNPFGVRIGAFLCWLVTAFFGYRLTANLFGKSAAFRTVLLLATLPLFFAFGFFMTPDSLLIACWAGAIYFLERALLGERPTRLVGGWALRGTGHALEVHDRPSGSGDVAVPALGPSFPTLAVQTRTVRCSVLGADPLFPGCGMEREPPLGVLRFSKHRPASESARVFAPYPDRFDAAASDSGRSRGDGEIAASVIEPFRRVRCRDAFHAPAAISPLFHPRTALRICRFQYQPRAQTQLGGTSLARRTAVAGP